MLGCSLAGIEQEEVLQSTTSQLLEGVLPLNVSWGSASGLADTSEPMYLLKADDGVRPCRCLLIKIPVLSDARHRGQKWQPRERAGHERTIPVRRNGVRSTGVGFPCRLARPGRPQESIVDIQETDTYTPGNRCSTDLLTGVVQHPKNLRKAKEQACAFPGCSFG